MCTANGIEIHYLRTGGDKPTLITLHGLMRSGACLSPLARALEEDLDVVMPDARGHGLSTAPAEGYQYADLAEDILGLVGKLGLHEPVILGHSMGGMTAAVAASQPESAIGGLVLLDPTFISPEWQREVYESDLVETHRQCLAQTKADLLAEARRRHPDRSDEIIEFMTDARLQTSLAALEVLKPPNPDYRALVSSIHTPVLLAIGDAGVISVETARELRSLNPLLRYEVVPDAGHGLPYDKPGAVANLVKSWLRSGKQSRHLF